MSLKQNLLSQFGHPRGWLGHIAGMIMANRRSNRERNEWTLSLLNLQPTDRILELGFGPGYAILRASEIVTRGFIVGLDRSQVMVSQAGQRNAARLADGRVMLMLGSLAALSELAGPFDKIFSVNVFPFWEDPVAVFQSLGRLLAPGGVIATTWEPRGSGATDEVAVKMGAQIAKALRAAGLTRIQQELKPTKPVSTVCVLAAKE